MTTSRREVSPEGRSAKATRAKPSPSLRRSEERAQKSAIRQTRSVLEHSSFLALLPRCRSIRRPSAAPALSDLVLQNRLRAAGRGSRSESVLRWIDEVAEGGIALLFEGMPGIRRGRKQNFILKDWTRDLRGPAFFCFAKAESAARHIPAALPIHKKAVCRPGV